MKEIKKALENCQKNNCLDCPYFIDEKRCRANDLLLDTITFINELESENERLANLLETERIVAKQRSAKLEKAEHDRDRYKKRIAELDDLVAEIYVSVENARKELKEAEEYVKREISKLFTSFAERIKMEFYYEFDEIIPSIMADKIDKLLKELQSG